MIRPECKRPDDSGSACDCCQRMFNFLQSEPTCALAVKDIWNAVDAWVPGQGDADDLISDIKRILMRGES